MAVVTTQEKDRFVYLDAMRGWAALLVVFVHGIGALDFAINTGRPIDSRGSWDIWISGTPFSLSSGGSLAVCTFFALSGFVLAHAYSRSRQSLLALASRRYVRLGLPMLVGCLLSWLLLVSGLMGSRQAAALITHSSWLHGQFQQSPDFSAALIEPVRLLFGFSVPFADSFDTSLWTMPIEAVGSLGLMTIFVILRRAGRNSETLAVCVFGVIVALCSGSYLSLFAFGAGLRLLQRNKILIALGKTRWVPAALLMLGLFFGTVPFSTTNRWAIYNGIASLANHFVWRAWVWPHSNVTFWHGIAAALILLAVASSAWLQSLFNRTLGRFLGRISFPLYILHVLVLMVVECPIILLSERAGLAPLAGAMLSLGVFVAASVGVAAALTPLMEGGAIAASAWVSNVVDGLLQWLTARITGVLRPAGAVE